MFPTLDELELKTLPVIRMTVVTRFSRCNPVP